MADFCEGCSARRGVALSDDQQVTDKPLSLILGAGVYGRSVAEAVLMSEQFSVAGFWMMVFCQWRWSMGFPSVRACTAFKQYVC